MQLIEAMHAILKGYVLFLQRRYLLSVSLDWSSVLCVGYHLNGVCCESECV